MNLLDDFGDQVPGTTKTSDYDACDFEVRHTYGLLHSPNPVFLGVLIRVSVVQYPHDPLPFILKGQYKFSIKLLPELLWKFLVSYGIMDRFVSLI